MPMLTRAKRKLLSVDECIDVSSKKRLKNITNLPKRAESVDSLKNNNENEPFLIRQFTIPIVKLAPVQERAALNGFSQLSQVPEISNKAVEMMRCVRATLERNFKNVEERLQLNFVVPCLYDLRNCAINHDSSPEIAAKDVFQSRIYLTQERYFQFFHFIRHSLCTKRKFPGPEILLLILQQIIKVPRFLIHDFYEIYISILNQYPPCQLRELYLNMLRSKFSSSPDAKNTFSTVLDLIHQMIYISDKEKSILENSSNDFNNFHQWEAQLDELSKFEALTRTERFERLFVILDLLVRTLEYDLSTFIVKNSNKFASNIFNQRTKPLVCSIIWQEFGGVAINSVIKKIISMYVAMNALNYGKDKIKIISRLLALISQVTNIFEYPDDTFEYPLYNNSSEGLALEVLRTTEASNYLDFDLYLNVIENIRSPLLQMLLTKELLKKITGENVDTSLEVPLNSLYHKYFEHYSDITRTLRENETYPVYNAKCKPKKQCKISQSNFLKLLLLYADAVNSYYQIQASLTEIKRSEQPKRTSAEEKEEPFDWKKFECAVDNVDMNEHVCLKQVELNFQKKCHIRLTKDSCKFYRREIMNLLLLIKLIKKLYAKDAAKFSDWMSFATKLQVGS